MNLGMHWLVVYLDLAACLGGFRAFYYLLFG